MNTALKHAEELRVPDDIWRQIQRCHEAARVIEEWDLKHPYPFNDASEMECKNWYRTMQAVKIATLQGMPTALACAYLKEAWKWTGHRHGLQFFFPRCRSVYARWLLLREKPYEELAKAIIDGVIRDV